MDIFNLNSILTKTYSDIIKNTPTVEPYQEESASRVVMKEQPFVITEEIEKNRAVITAHFIEDYKFTDYRLVMSNNVDTWLYKLLKAQEYV